MNIRDFYAKTLSVMPFLAVFASLTIASIVLDSWVGNPYASGQMKFDIEKAVKEVFSQIVQENQTKEVDFVLIIDASKSMATDIQKIVPVLGDIGYTSSRSNIDCRFGLATFWGMGGESKVEIYSTLTSTEVIQNHIASATVKDFRRSGGFALDAMFKSIREVPFRTGALKHILLITDQPLRSSQSSLEEKLASEIISMCSKSQIVINIIGASDELSQKLTLSTKGKLQSMSDSTEVRSPVLGILGKHILKIDGIMRELAKHIAKTCRPTVDVIFMLDSSQSMANKVDDIIAALPIFSEEFDKSNLDYQFGAIRFYAASGGGESRTIISQPPLSLGDIKKLLQIPKIGDEHLLDAILEGIPKVKTRPEAKTSVVIFTDEPSTTAQRYNANWTSEAVAICKANNIQVNAVGASSFRPTGSVGSFAYDFQMKAPQATGGMRFVMPGSDVTPSETR